MANNPYYYPIPGYGPPVYSRRYGGTNPYAFGSPFYSPIPPYFFSFNQARNSYYNQQQRNNQQKKCNQDSYSSNKSQNQQAQYKLTEADNFRISAGAILNSDSAKRAKKNLMEKLKDNPFFSRLSTGSNLQERLSAAVSEAFVLTSETNGYGAPGNGVIEKDFQSFYKNLQLTLSRARDAGDGTKRAFGSISERLAHKYFDRIKDVGNGMIDELNMASSSGVEMQRVSTFA